MGVVMPTRIIFFWNRQNKIKTAVSSLNYTSLHWRKEWVCFTSSDSELYFLEQRMLTNNIILQPPVNLAFGILYPSMCNFGWCFLFSSLQSRANWIQKTWTHWWLTHTETREKTRPPKLYIWNMYTVAQCQSRKELAAVAITLNDLRSKFYSWRWPAGLKHIN
jgi:hypothetical protein